MHFNFELILFYATLITGLIALSDILYFAPKRKQRVLDAQVTQKDKEKFPWWSDYARSFFPVLLLVFLLRSFLYEPFRIPTGSLEPTLLAGDFILVNKFDYGIRLPVIHKKIFSIGEPKRGDIVIFRWPPNPSVDFIKRVIGLPGDKISYINKELYINNQLIPQEKLKEDSFGGNTSWQTVEKEENLLGIHHKIYQNSALSIARRKFH